MPRDRDLGRVLGRATADLEAVAPAAPEQGSKGGTPDFNKRVSVSVEAATYRRWSRLVARTPDKFPARRIYRMMLEDLENDERERRERRGGRGSAPATEG